MARGLHRPHIAGDGQATVEWAARRYKEMLARGEAHARPHRMILIDGTGERDVFEEIRVEESERAPDR